MHRFSGWRGRRAAPARAAVKSREGDSETLLQEESSSSEELHLAPQAPVPAGQKTVLAVAGEQSVPINSTLVRITPCKIDEQDIK